MPKTNPAGLAIIKASEGDVLRAYWDRYGQVWTIGYGHTGPDVGPGLAITQERAEELLESDLERTEKGVNSLCARAISSNQFSALVSFAYNEGLEQLAESTLMHLVNAGHFAEAANQFSFWIYAGGVILPGLITRRAKEQALFRQKEEPHAS